MFYVTTYFLFSSEAQNFVDLGFGTVFDGGHDFGQFSDLSTQAVMDLIRNVSEGDQGDQGIVQIAAKEVDQFCVNANDGIGQGSIQTGE